MTLLGPPVINTIKSKLSNAVSAKDPLAIASAVELPTLPKRIEGVTGSGGSASQQHGESLRVDGADWSNVLNPLLDAHLSIQLVRPWSVHSLMRGMHLNLNLGVGCILFQSKGLIRFCIVPSPVRFNWCNIMRGDVSPSSVWTSTRAIFPVVYRAPDADGNPVLQHYYFIHLLGSSILLFYLLNFVTDAIYEYPTNERMIQRKHTRPNPPFIRR
jgi:hypothetical protein